MIALGSAHFEHTKVSLLPSVMTRRVALFAPLNPKQGFHLDIYVYLCEY